MSARKKTAKWAEYKNKKRLRRKGKCYRPNMGTISNKIILVAPSNFSIIENRYEVIEYINKVFSNAESGLFSRMDLGSINKTDPITVSLIISLMMDGRIRSRQKLEYIEVKTPSVYSDPGEVFSECHFETTVTSGTADQNYFLSRTSDKVNQEYTGDIIDFAEDRGVADAATILNAILVEIFSNTNNHATPADENNKVPWFMSIVERSDRLCFSIIDLGVGIYESLRSSDAIKNIPEVYDVVANMYHNEQSRYLSLSIPAGVYSSTKESVRGKGLKTIYEKASRSTGCVKFVIITNRAMVDIMNIDKIAPDIATSFGGTAYYWEMRKCIKR